MPRLLAILLCALLIVLPIGGPVSAFDTSQEPVLFGSPYAPKVSVDFTKTGSTLPSSNFSYSGPSLKTITDANGYVTYAPNNLLLNSATLSTQNVTTSPIN